MKFKFVVFCDDKNLIQSWNIEKNLGDVVKHGPVNPLDPNNCVLPIRYKKIIGTYLNIYGDVWVISIIILFGKRI